MATETLWTGKHRSHLMHANSLASWSQLDVGDRSKAIAEAFREHGAMTDREAMKVMGFSETNMVRPRITELTDLHILVECGRMKCETTGRTVRLSRIA